MGLRGTLAAPLDLHLAQEAPPPTCLEWGNLVSQTGCLSGVFTFLDGDRGGYGEEAEVQPPSDCSSRGAGMTIQGGGPSYRSNCVLAAHPGVAAKGPWSVGSGLAWSPPGAGLLAARGSEAGWVWTGVSSQLGF